MLNTFPFQKLLIEINQTCNLNCDFCFYRDYGRKTNRLDIHKIRDILNSFPYANEFYLTGGECTINTDICEIVEFLSLKGNVNVFTNGFLLNCDFNKYKEIEKFASKIYLTVHETDFGNMPTNKLESLDKEKIVLKFNINNMNYLKIKEFIQYYKDLGFSKFSFNFIHNIKSNKINYELYEDEKIKFLNDIKDCLSSTDIEDIQTQIELLKNSNLKTTGLCGKSFGFVDCGGIIYNCPSAMEQDCYITCNNCNKFSKECISLWEMF